MNIIDNSLKVLLGSVQCLTMIIGSIFLMNVSTTDSMEYCLGFVSFTLNTLAIILSISLNGSGPYKNSYWQIVNFLNNTVLASTIILFTGVFTYVLALDTPFWWAYYFLYFYCVGMIFCYYRIRNQKVCQMPYIDTKQMMCPIPNVLHTEQY
jgi:hypothetical protein